MASGVERPSEMRLFGSVTRIINNKLLQELKFYG